MKNKIRETLHTVYSRIQKAKRDKARQEWHDLLETNGIKIKKLRERCSDNEQELVTIDPAQPQYLIIPQELAMKIATLGDLP